MNTAKCAHCRQYMFVPGGIPRARHFWSDWQRLCPACSWAEGQAAAISHAYVPPPDAYELRQETPELFDVLDFVSIERFNADEYWAAFDQLIEEDHWEFLRQQMVARLRQDAILTFSELVRVPSTDVVFEKIWSWDS